MKEYPKILRISDSDKNIGEKCIVFDKIDGSNLQFTFSKKQGWYKFATRTRLIDRNEPEYGIAIDLFINKYGDFIEKILNDKYPKFNSVTAYAEFYGPYSFAGQHSEEWLKNHNLLSEGENSPKDVILFDININKHGFLDPFKFVELFSKVEIPKIISEGILTKEFIEEIRNNDALNEGVICKGGTGPHKIWLRKIKTFNYLKKIKEAFGTGWTNYWE